MNGAVDPIPHASERSFVVQANAVSTTRLLLVAWPLMLLIGVVISLAVGSIIPFAIAALVFTGLGWFAWPPLKMQWQWGRPTLRLEAPAVRLGEEAHFVFEQTSRRPIDVSTASLTTELSCEEAVSWETGHGDERKTHSRELIVATSDGTHSAEPTPQGLRALGTLAVPAHAGAPTMRLDNNEISWKLETKLDGRRLPAAKETFEITVIPQLAAPVQDTIRGSVGS